MRWPPWLRGPCWRSTPWVALSVVPFALLAAAEPDAPGIGWVLAILAAIGPMAYGLAKAYEVVRRASRETTPTASVTVSTGASGANGEMAALRARMEATETAQLLSISHRILEVADETRHVLEQHDKEFEAILRELKHQTIALDSMSLELQGIGRGLDRLLHIDPH